MHIFGLFTTASTLEELDDMVKSAAVVLSSPSSGAHVEKHFKNLQSLLTKKGVHIDETEKSKISSEDLKVNDNTQAVSTITFTF